MIKVFTIDDSLLVQRQSAKIISNIEGVELIGSANNPVEAIEVLKTVPTPDVLLLDLEMPKMNGMEYLEYMKEHNTQIPTIIYSSYVDGGSQNAIKALGLGASDIIHKGGSSLLHSSQLEAEFKQKIYAVSKVNFIPTSNNNKKSNIIYNSTASSTKKIVAIGSSTGGVETLEAIIKDLLPNHTPIVIVQHMPAGFTKSFAIRLDKLYKNSTISEANNGDILESGHIYIAPGDRHLELEHHHNTHYKISLQDYPKVSHHKPSVDVLFASVANIVGEDAISFILTGMGVDGVKGIGKIKKSGGVTYSQDRETSIVYGMPKAAYESGAIDAQLPLYRVAQKINDITHT